MQRTKLPPPRAEAPDWQTNGRREQNLGLSRCVAVWSLLTKPMLLGFHARLKVSGMLGAAGVAEGEEPGSNVLHVAQRS